MAKKPSKKPAPSKPTTTTRVTRISATDKQAPKKPRAKKVAEVTKAETKGLKKPAHSPESSVVKEQKAIKGAPSKNPIKGLIEYFKGAWYELRQVRWPDRSTSWRMTGALLLFTAFFVLIILLLDAAFKSLFELIIG